MRVLVLSFAHSVSECAFLFEVAYSLLQCKPLRISTINRSGGARATPWAHLWTLLGLRLSILFFRGSVRNHAFVLRLRQVLLLLTQMTFFIPPLAVLLHAFFIYLMFLYLPIHVFAHIVSLPTRCIVVLYLVLLPLLLITTLRLRFPLPYHVLHTVLLPLFLRMLEVIWNRHLQLILTSILPLFVILLDLFILLLRSLL